MITINKILKRYGVVPHPRIKGRYTLINRENSVVVKTKKELVAYVRHHNFELICSIWKWEKYYYPDGRLKEPRDAQWFKENHPEFYKQCFIDDHLHINSTDIVDPKIKEDLDIYCGFSYAPFQEIKTTEILGSTTSRLINLKKRVDTYE